MVLHQKELEAALRGLGGKKRHKYGAKRKVSEDGIGFDSTAEFKRYCELKLLVKAGDIQSLEVHPVLDIIWPESQALICRVELDFKYYDDDTKTWRYEDVKGVDTALSRLKRRLVEAVHEIKVEVIK